jgi:hypothetical protein
MDVCMDVRLVTTTRKLTSISSWGCRCPQQRENAIYRGLLKRGQTQQTPFTTASIRETCDGCSRQTLDFVLGTLLYAACCLSSYPQLISIATMPAFMALPGHVLQSELARDVFWSGKQCVELGFHVWIAPVKLSLALTGTAGRGAGKAVKIVSETALNLLEVKVDQVRVVVRQSQLDCFFPCCCKLSF